MNKKKILHELIFRLKEEIRGLESSAKAQVEFATDSEFKAESKYDTRSLEASYLASAESKRVEELKLELQMLEEVDFSYPNHSVHIGSLVELKYRDIQKKYFLIPTAGGTVLSFDDETLLVVSVFSPIGDAMLGLGVGDSFEVETPKETREYEILSIS